MKPIKAFAPAKVNLTLHVTGRRDDGYHMLDSLVMFADVGDRISVTQSDVTRLKVTGPMAAGVPADSSNLVVKAAELMGISADIRLKKFLPNAAGIGGGSSDAAATLRALSLLSGQPVPDNVLSLGADVPVCLAQGAARMQGIGDRVISVPGLPMLHAVLVNPMLPVPTARIFERVENHENPPMPRCLPTGVTAAELIQWLATQRNDLQEPAIAAEPAIEQVFRILEVTPGCLLARMSGSGATCFGLYTGAETAASAAGRLQETYPGWWVAATRLNSVS